MYEVMFIDGFDNYDSLKTKWDMSYTGMSIVQGAGRRATAGLHLYSNDHRDEHCLGKGFDPISDIIVGLAYKRVKDDTGSVSIRFMNDSVVQCKVDLGWEDIVFTTNSGVTGQCSSCMASGTWNYIEMGVSIHDLNGYAEIRVDESTVISGSNIDTTTSGSTVNSVRIYVDHESVHDESYAYIDDVYMSSVSGTVGSSFLGICLVDVIYPVASGINNDFDINYVVDDYRYGLVDGRSTIDGRVFENIIPVKLASDDGYYNNVTSFNTDMTTIEWKGPSTVSFFRLSGVNLPKNVTIVDARFYYKTVYSYFANAITLYAKFEYSGVPVDAVLSQTDLDNRPLTSDATQVSWNAENDDFPNIKDALQEVIDRPDWVENDNTLMLKVRSSSAASYYTRINTYEYDYARWDETEMGNCELSDGNLVTLVSGTSATLAWAKSTWFQNSDLWYWEIKVDTKSSMTAIIGIGVGTSDFDNDVLGGTSGGSIYGWGYSSYGYKEHQVFLKARKRHTLPISHPSYSSEVAKNIGVRATCSKSPSSGKWYWEVRIECPDVYSASSSYCGIGTVDAGLEVAVGSNVSGWAYRLDGKICHGGVVQDYGVPALTGSIVGIALDTSTSSIWFSVDGAWQGGGNPVTNTNPAFSDVYSVVYPMVSTSEVYNVLFYLYTTSSLSGFELLDSSVGWSDFDRYYNTNFTPSAKSYMDVDEGGGSRSFMYGDSYAVGDTIGVAYDASNNGRLWFSKNGNWQGNGDPETGVFPTFEGVGNGEDIYAIVSVSLPAGGGIVKVITKFGSTGSFSYDVPENFNHGFYNNIDDWGDVPGTSHAYTENTPRLYIQYTIDSNYDSDEYVQSKTVGNKDTYKYNTLSGTSTAYAIQHNLVSKPIDGHTLGSEALVVLSGTEYTYNSSSPTEYDIDFLLGGVFEVLDSVYERKLTVLTNNPYTSSAWTEEEINAIEGGLKVV